MATTAWSTQQLAEFVAAVAGTETESAAARAAVERAAEALDADVAAIVCGDELVAAVGYAEGSEPIDALAHVAADFVGSSLDVPGVGVCAASAATLDHPEGAKLVVARPDALTREETGLLRGMARVASMTMRMLRVLDDERRAREELERLARGQAALRHVATLVARAAPPAEIFAAVAKEVGRLVGADRSFVARYEEDETVTVIAAWTATSEPMPETVAVGGRYEYEPESVSSRVRATGRAARADEYTADPSGRVAALGIRSAVGAPITVEGRLWGVVTVASLGAAPPPRETEERLASFTELVATAIANAEAQAALAASRARIIATADETRRRIERDLHDGAQQRLVSLALELRAAQAAVPPELDELATELERVTKGLTSAVDELREYARGIHPAILTEGGLSSALKTLAHRSAVPVELDVRLDGRQPEPIELGVYYVVSEALTNAAKHANATAVTVRVEAVADVMRLSIRDDGVGGAAFARGSGLVGLKDRVEALGGRIAVESPRGAGTSIFVELPLSERWPSPRSHDATMTP